MSIKNRNFQVLEQWKIQNLSQGPGTVNCTYLVPSWRYKTVSVVETVSFDQPTRWTLSKQVINFVLQYLLLCVLCILKVNMSAAGYLVTFSTCYCNRSTKIFKSWSAENKSEGACFRNVTWHPARYLQLISQVRMENSPRSRPSTDVHLHCLPFLSVWNINKLRVFS